MTQDDIIRMYEEANGWSPAGFPKTVDELERFAALVVAAEREKYLALLRQMHDAYALAANPFTLRARGQA